jgi:trans-aconitate 2-methyltransferase
MQWDPEDYLRFGDERARPFFDLVNRIHLQQARVVIDLGCGPGTLTATLAQRWPMAQVLGIDSSEQMIHRASVLAGERIGFALGDLAAWEPAERVDVVVSNAALQWVPDHRALLPRFAAAINPGGYLAFQVPGNFDGPSHRVLFDLAADARFAGHTEGIQRGAVAEPADYLDDLGNLGMYVDAWETTYLHVLPGRNAVFDWMAGTGARPVLQALPADLRETFSAELRDRLRAAYPPHAYGTVLPFRRIFVVARHP